MIAGRKAHSAQKPESLLYRVLLATTNPGDIVLDPFFGTGTTGAVARKLGRHYIGIERDSSYLEVAAQRIATVEIAPESALQIPNPRQQKRIPFGALLEAGLLQPGQTLQFVHGGQRAFIMADGSLRCGELTGSIHSVARALSNNRPTNGWDCWLYATGSGQFIPIDMLRDQIREENNPRGENNL